eukprot:XP_001609509.1 hypothetical protein [Babesia bovis T2Bo]
MGVDSRMAYATLAHASASDNLLCANFRYPDSHDVVIVRGRQLVLYTMLSTSHNEAVPCEPSLYQKHSNITNQDAQRDFGRHVSKESLRFVAETTLMDAPISAHVIPDIVFHSYHKDEDSTEAVRSCQDVDVNLNAHDHGSIDVDSADTNESQTNSEHIHATSALLLVFNNGRMVISGFNTLQNTFVTLSLHIFDRKLDLKDNEQYASLPLMEKQRITTIKETHVAVAQVHKWKIISQRSIDQKRSLNFGHSVLIALCHNERLIYLVQIGSIFTLPPLVTDYTHNPYSEHQESGTRQTESDQHSITMVPWLRVDSVIELDIDVKLGFCDDRYFLRGLDFVKSCNNCILGILMATKPETIGTHAMDGPDYVIGGMSFVAVVVDTRTRSCNVIHRVDKLPMDTIAVVGVPTSVHGAPSFILRTLDFLLWTTLMSPTLCWQFMSPLGLVNTRFDDTYYRGYQYKFLDAMHLSVDLRDYVISTLNNMFILMPRKRGTMYIGKPVTDAEGVLQNIYWTTLGVLDFEVTSSQFVTIDEALHFVATGNGVAIGRFLATVPPGFNKGVIQDDGPVELREVNIPEIPTKIKFNITASYKDFMESTECGVLEPIYIIGNQGAIRDPKNVTLPELWQIGCIKPSRSGIDNDKIPPKDRITQKFKPQRRPWAVNDRQMIDVATVDYQWPKQQSIVGLCDDSKLTVLMEKYPLHTVISVPLQSGTTILPLEYNSNKRTHLKRYSNNDTYMLLTCNGSTAYVKLNEELLDIKAKCRSDRKTQVHPEGLDSTVDTTIETAEHTLAYATVLDNTYIVQVTPTKAVFMDILNCDQVCTIDMLKYMSGHIRSAEILDDTILCLSTNGNAYMLTITNDANGPAVDATIKIGNDDISHIGIYKPNRLNNVFGNVCILLLTNNSTLLCYRKDTLERIFALKDLNQVYPQLFNDETVQMNIQTLRPRNDTNVSSTKGRPLQDQTPDPTDVHKVSTKQTRKKAKKMTAVKSDETDTKLNADSNEKSQNVKKSCQYLPSQETIAATVSRWNKLRAHESTMEYIIAVQMLDIAATDVGPTLVIMMTGRPLLIYRAYLLNCNEYAFQIIYHKFVNPVPSAIVNVTIHNSQQHLFMQLNKNHWINKCISKPIFNGTSAQDLEECDLNHATVVYPHVSTNDAMYYLVNAESTELSMGAKPLTRSSIANNTEIKAAVDVIHKRWKDFTPPCLRLTSVANKLAIHEYEMENVLDMDTVLGEAEARIVSLFSIVNHERAYSRYVVFMTLPGTMVLCVPGALQQNTNINRDISLQQIVAGSDDPEYLPAKRQLETTYNPLFCALQSEDELTLNAKLSCERLSEHAGGLEFNDEFISQKVKLGDMRGKLVAVSHKNYYLTNGVIRANRNATIATLPVGKDMQHVMCGRLVALVIQRPVPVKEELVTVLNERINLQLRQLETEQLPTGTKPTDIVEPNKQICNLIQTLGLMPEQPDKTQPLWRDTVLVLHMGNLQYWVGEYEVEPMESVLSMTFGIIGNREYLLIGTCTNLGENVESKGDVVVIDLQSMFQKQPENGNVTGDHNDAVMRRSVNCAVLNQYCKRIFPGPVTYLTSLNTDFDLIFRPNFKFQEDVANIGKSDSVMIYGNEESGRWTVTHFAPNFSLFVHAVGPRLFVHEVAGKQFVRGAFAEIPLCVSSACVFDKYVLACDINQGLHFFMYRYDALNDSRTLCKIGATVKKVDLSVVSCAPVVNTNALGLLASDYFANVILFKNESEAGGRDTLVVTAAVRLPTRVTHFIRREQDFRYISPLSGSMGFCADGSVILVVIPESQPFQFFKTVQTTMEASIPPPLGVPRNEIPFFTSQMAQTQHMWPGDEAILHLDLLK